MMAKTFTVLMAALLLLMLDSESWSQTAAQPSAPLCITQIAVANRACAAIPFMPHSAAPAEPRKTVVHHPGHIKRSGAHNHTHNGGHDHGHSHRHRHRHHNFQSEEKEECCRWLEVIDAQCICDLLLRLPSSLARPIHGYKVVVEDECEVEFECPGRLRP